MATTDVLATHKPRYLTVAWALLLLLGALPVLLLVHVPVFFGATARESREP